MMEQSKMVAFSNRVYTLLLHAYPAPFRREYGREMAQVFRDDLRGSLQEGGRSAVFGLWLLTFFDLVKTAVSEHILEVFHMPVEKMTRWSGPAAAIGGIMFSLGIFLGFEFNDVFTSLITAGIFISFPLLGLGLLGLYKRLAANSGWQNSLFFLSAFLGLLIYNLSLLALFLIDNITNESYLIVPIIGFVLLGVGLVGMGYIALSTNSLDKWSFTPILAGVVTLFIIINFALSFNSSTNGDTTSYIELISFALSWVLLGIGIMQNQGKEETDQALYA